MSRIGRFTTGIAALAATLVADQASKDWVLNGLRLPDLGSVPVFPGLSLTMVWNHGITFGLLSSGETWGGTVLAVIALGVVAALGVWMWRAERLGVVLALGAVSGGAIGNVIDRMRFGAVVDFIHAYALGWSWYVFNVADAAIVCGVAALVIDGMRHPDRLAATRPAK
ncbi:MAG: signal peptidase II [Alphaproteobacteria bacterium]|nr:signal peptidase II [Alphaproteobacteria bacterium]